MRINNNGSIYYERTNQIKLLPHNLTIGKIKPDEFDLIMTTNYEIITLFTDKDNIINVYEYLPDTETYIIKHKYNSFNPGKIIEKGKGNAIIKNISNNNYNPEYNCHGFSFLDSKFWFNASNYDIENIIIDDGYTISNNIDDIKMNSIILLYLNDILLHSCVYKGNSIYKNKVGCRQLAENNSLLDFQSIPEYKYNKILILNK